MKVAKNMDSVFDSCSDQSLDFDIFFDDDDTIIDIVNGFDKSGVPLTGQNPEDVYQKDGDASNDDPAEGSKEIELDDSGEQGKEGIKDDGSAESQAYDVTPEIKKAIGEATMAKDGKIDLDDSDIRDVSNSTAVQVAKKGIKDTVKDAAKKAGDAIANAPKGAKIAAGAAATGAAALALKHHLDKKKAEQQEVKKESFENDYDYSDLLEGFDCDPLADDDEAERAGINCDEKMAVDGGATEDPIEDVCDDGQRLGKVKTNNGDNMEGVKQDIPGTGYNESVCELVAEAVADTLVENVLENLNDDLTVDESCLLDEDTLIDEALDYLEEKKNYVNKKIIAARVAKKAADKIASKFEDPDSAEAKDAVIKNLGPDVMTTAQAKAKHQLKKALSKEANKAARATFQNSPISNPANATGEHKINKTILRNIQKHAKVAAAKVAKQARKEERAIKNDAYLKGQQNLLATFNKGSAPAILKKKSDEGEASRNYFKSILNMADKKPDKKVTPQDLAKPSQDYFKKLLNAGEEPKAAAAKVAQVNKFANQQTGITVVKPGAILDPNAGMGGATGGFAGKFKDFIKNHPGKAAAIAAGSAAAIGGLAYGAKKLHDKRIQDKAAAAKATNESFDYAEYDRAMNPMNEEAAAWLTVALLNPDYMIENYAYDENYSFAGDEYGFYDEAFDGSDKDLGDQSDNDYQKMLTDADSVDGTCKESAAIEEGYMILEAAQNGLYSLNEAKFTFLPKFKQFKELEPYETVAKDAEAFLNSEGENPKTGFNRAIKLLAKFNSLLDNISAVLTPLATLNSLRNADLLGASKPAVLVGSIIGYVINRAIVYVHDSVSEAMLRSQLTKIIRSYDKLIAKAEGGVKSDLEAKKAKVQDALNKLNMKDIKESVDNIDDDIETITADDIDEIVPDSIQQADSANTITADYDETCKESAMIEEGYMILEAAQNGLYSLNEAKFTFLPKFKQFKELEPYERTAKEAEAFLNSEGENPKTGFNKAIKLLAKFNSLFDNITSVLSPLVALNNLRNADLLGISKAAVLVGNIIGYVINRALVYVHDSVSEAMLRRQLTKIIASYDKLIAKAEGGVKSDLEAKKAKVQDALDRLSINESVNEAAMIEEGYMILEAAQNGLYSLNEAKFTFLPKFSQLKELEPYETAAKEAETFLNSEGENPKTGFNKAIKLLAKFNSVLDNITAVLYPLTTLGQMKAFKSAGLEVNKPAMVIGAVIGYIVNRAIVYVHDSVSEAMLRRQLTKIIASYNKLIAKAEGDTKADLIKRRDKIQDALNKLSMKDIKNESVNFFEDDSIAEGADYFFNQSSAINPRLAEAINSIREAKEDVNTSSVQDDVEEDLDDADIESIDSEETPKSSDLAYDYSDDELIDMAINGQSF